MKVNKKEIGKELNSYYYYLPCVNIQGDDLYRCSCGNVGHVSPERITYKVSDEMSIFGINQEIDNSLNSLLLGKRIINSRCSKCNKDLSVEEITAKLQNFNTVFFERFYVNETTDSLTLTCIRAGMNYNIQEKFESKVILESYIKINKSSKRIYIKQFNETKHKLIHLDDIFDSIVIFFKREPEITYSDGYINVHDWIGKLAKTIRDAKNMNIVDELLNYMIGKSGFDILAKIAVVFLSIISYPNLSTISLTKGNIFLFDLIANCKLPNIQFLKRKQATSPIKIFNTLVQLKNKNIQQKLDNDDKSKLEYLNLNSETSDIIQKIKNENLNIINQGENIKKNKGKIFVRDNISKRSITPLWFSKLKKFSDYENSINWLRIIKFEQFIDLLNKYDLDFLLKAYRVLEFRDDLNYDRIKQFLELMKDYCVESFKLESENQLKNYEPVLKFDFNMFDDCYRMIEELKWDPKKVLFKIKKNKKLYELHENLLKHRSYVSNNEINQRFIEFSEKFKFLENYSKDLNIHLDIKLISTPEQLMNHAVEMHNCAGSYVRKVANGQYISFIVFDNSPERTKEEFYKYMMVIEITALGLEFVGIKSKFNKYGSNRFKEDVKKYLIDKDINFKDVPSIKTDVQSTEVAYKGFFENIIKD